MPDFPRRNVSFLDLSLLVISGILFVLSIILWYLAFISDWIILFLIATILLAVALFSLILAFILVIKEFQQKLVQLETRIINLDSLTSRVDQPTNFVSQSSSKIGDSPSSPPSQVKVVTLSAIEWRIINYLRSHSQIMQNDLIEGCNLSKSTVSSNLSSLELKGIIKREKRGKINEVILIQDPVS